MSQNGKLQPNFDQQGTKMLNLTVLQRVDPFVEEILMTAAHVTFYGFDIELNQWGRKDVEGSLFVVKRNAQPRFQFIVMNRRTADNLVENLLGDFEYEVQLPYLLYRNADQEVNGIWFYNEQECKDVGKLFERILSAYAKVPSKAQVSSTKSEFEELEGYPTMGIMGGPLEPASSSASHAAEVPDDPSFVNFFSAAMNIGNAPSANITSQPYQPSALIPSQQPSAPFTLPTIQVPSPHAPTSLRPVLDSPQLSSRTRTTNLVKPSSFFNPPSTLTHMMPPIPSSLPTAPPLNTSGTLHRPYGAPLLQPFPPPTPSPSLTPTPFPSQNNGPVLSKEKVRDALLSLVQEDQFVDMVYRALLNAHHT